MIFTLLKRFEDGTLPKNYFDEIFEKEMRSIRKQEIFGWTFLIVFLFLFLSLLILGLLSDLGTFEFPHYYSKIFISSK